MWHTGETLGFRTVIERFHGRGAAVACWPENRAELDVDSWRCKQRT